MGILEGIDYGEWAVKRSKHGFESYIRSAVRFRDKRWGSKECAKFRQKSKDSEAPERNKLITYFSFTPWCSSTWKELKGMNKNNYAIWQTLVSILALPLSALGYWAS